MVMAKLYALAGHWQIEFRFLYRSLFSLVDMSAIWLLVRVLAKRDWRFLAAGLYAIAPIALVLGAMHGNTDTLVAVCLLVTCLAAGGGRPILTGICIGFGAWIKIPALFVAPAFGFAFPRWRDRLTCTFVALAVAVSSYLPSLAANPLILWRRIFGYRGFFISTISEPPIWVWGFKNWFVRGFGHDMKDWPAAFSWYRDNSYYVAFPLMLTFAFLRRRRNDAESLALTVAGSYAMFYAFTESWAFQYFAWSMPFWLVAGWRFGLAANLFAGGYIYVLYAMVCKDWLLRPVWAFHTFPNWPFGLILLRDLAHATFVIFTLVVMRRAFHSELAFRGTRRLKVQPRAVKRPKRPKSR